MLTQHKQLSTTGIETNMHKEVQKIWLQAKVLSISIVKSKLQHIGNGNSAPNNVLCIRLIQSMPTTMARHTGHDKEQE